jgi:NADH:ubiquinone oxidoreductase subunit 2 (subunit N)
VNVLYFVQNYIFKNTGEFLEPLLDKFLILFIVSFLFGNIFSNYSFVLSAIGASCAEISAFICMSIFKKKRKKKQNIILFSGLISSRFFQEVLVTMLTCVLVGVILSPLTYNSTPQK